jgi:hypothetical protein
VSCIKYWELETGPVNHEVVSSIVWYSKKKDETESKAKVVAVLELYVKFTAWRGQDRA